MISQALLQSLVILLPLSVSAAPPAQPTAGGPATQTVEVTAAAASGQNGLQAGAPNANVMANNVVVNATVYPIDVNEWDKAWAANTNSTLLNAPNGVVDTSISVEQGDDVSDLSSDLPDCQGRLPGDPDYDALDDCAYPMQGSGGSWEPDQPTNSTGGFPDCQFRFPEDPGYNANDECARGDKFPDLPANFTDPELAGDLSSNFTGGNISLTAPGMYPDCQDRYPGEPGYDPNDECATGGGSGGGSGGGAGQYPDCQGRYPGEPGYDAYDDCATGGQGGGGQRSTRYHLEYNIGGRSAVTVSKPL